MTPYISIIVPVYDVERYLRECLDSIIAWEFQEWEAILVDDGSPDRSGEICDEYAAQDCRFCVIHKENGGVSSARNAALDVARGTWVWFVDSDDVIDPHTPVDKTLLSQYDFVMFDEAIRFSGQITFEDNHNATTRSTHENKHVFFNHHVTYQHQTIWYLREKLQDIRFSTSLKYGEDLEFMRKSEILCLYPIKVNHVNYYYRLRSGSVMRLGQKKNIRMVGDVLIVLKHLLAFIDKHDVKAERWLERRIEGHLKVIAVHAARGHVFDSDTQQALRRSVKAFRERGFNVFRRIDYRVATWSLRAYAMVFNMKERLAATR